MERSWRFKMSKLASLPGGKKYTIHGIEMEFKSVEVDADAAELLEGTNIPPDKQLDIIKRLIRKMVKDSVPDVTEKELKD